LRDKNLQESKDPQVVSEPFGELFIRRTIFFYTQESVYVSMESLSPQVVSAAKLPILNPNEFDLWKMRIEQYFLMTDYSLWEVIFNGDSLAPTKVIEGVVQPVAPTTAEQRLARKNELNACGTLLMALPDKHQLKFNIHKDAKTLMLQKLISQLEILRESLSQEDINLKFLRNLPAKWRTHTLIWRNKTDLEEQSLDDLFNSLKIYEAEVYKVVKALYGLHQAPRAWYKSLANYLLENGFQRGKIDQTLFIKRIKGDILLVQIYVDDIIFGSSNKDLCKAFEKLMKEKFQMSSMGKLTFFLGVTPLFVKKTLCHNLGVSSKHS
nr:putative ribonuclease H-like domain-containing protein [Tanacetum cinerariifolium]